MSVDLKDIKHLCPISHSPFFFFIFAQLTFSCEIIDSTLSAKI